MTYEAVELLTAALNETAARHLLDTVRHFRAEPNSGAPRTQNLLKSQDSSQVFIVCRETVCDLVVDIKMDSHKFSRNWQFNACQKKLQRFSLDVAALAKEQGLTTWARPAGIFARGAPLPDGPWARGGLEIWCSLKAARKDCPPAFRGAMQ